MPVRLLDPLKSTQRKRKPQLWDSLTVGLAIAVVLLGFVIFLAPKSAQPERTPAKHLPSTMAGISSRPSSTAAAQAV
jgi:hypothetical protein